MRYKNIIKRGINNVEWLEGYLENKLDGNNSITIKASEKTYNNVFYRYGRVLCCDSVTISKNQGCTPSSRLIFLNDNYMFMSDMYCHTGKYGNYYIVKIFDIKKIIDIDISNLITLTSNLFMKKNKEVPKELIKEYVTTQVNFYYNPLDGYRINYKVLQNLLVNNIEELEGKAEELENKIDELLED